MWILLDLLLKILLSIVGALICIYVFFHALMLLLYAFWNWPILMALAAVVLVVIWYAVERGDRF